MSERNNDQRRVDPQLPALDYRASSDERSAKQTPEQEPSWKELVWTIVGEVGAYVIGALVIIFVVISRLKCHR